MSEIDIGRYYDESIPASLLPAPVPPTAPVLTSLTPDTIVAGPGGVTTIVVAGTGFVAGASRVYVDDVQYPTTFVSDVELTFQGQGDQPGTQTITVSANAAGQGQSNAIELTLTALAGDPSGVSQQPPPSPSGGNGGGRRRSHP
jgi:hypothetical protein